MAAQAPLLQGDARGWRRRRRRYRGYKRMAAQAPLLQGDARGWRRRRPRCMECDIAS